MAKSNNPETDVNELIKRVRAEAVRRSLASLQGDGSDRASATLPEIPHAAPLPVVIAPHQVDLKTDQLTNVIEHARETTQVSKRIPRPFRRLFRKQGRYNNLLLESVTILAEATGRLSRYIGELASGFETQIRLEKSLKSLETQIDVILEYVCNLRNQQDRITEETRRIHAPQDQVGNQFRDLGQHLNNLQTQADSQGQHLKNLQTQVDRACDQAENSKTKSDDARQIALRVDERQSSDGAFLKSEFHLLSRRLFELRSAGSRQNEPATGGVASPVEAHEFDAFYVAFENQFRGSRELIKERARIYLNDVSDAGLGHSDSPILDLGCGRGEWIELVIENGFTAEGVDLNAIMVAECKQRGFPITEGDALEYLRSLPAESRGVITAFHLIEHLEFRILVELLHESLRVLRPGGLAIFETPNPDNVLVGSNRFYSDPTHRHPLPKEYTSFLLRSVGFTGVIIRPLHPDKNALLKGDEAPELRNFLNRLFFGDQDYAVIGRKTAEKSPKEKVASEEKPAPS
jgi:O-antigen chain-terminating methyltransferase